MALKSGLGGRGKSKTKFQHNYLEVVKGLIPDLYVDTDRSVHGMEDDIMYTVLGKVLQVAASPNSVIDFSGIAPSSIRQHFIARNEKCHIRPYILDQKIIRAFGKRISNYKNFHDFSGFIASSVLPHMIMNNPSETFVEGLKGVDTAFSAATVTEAHTYLQDTLSWFYFLNTAGPVGGWDPSAGVHRVLSTKAFYGETITEADGIQLLFEYLWKNRELQSVASATSIYNKDYIPHQFLTASASELSGIANYYSSTQSYVSGDLPLEGLKTLLGAWYNDKDDMSTTLDDSLDLLLTTGEYPKKTIEAGPFTKFIRAVSFGFYDVNTVAEDLGELFDIERCPPRFLRYLAANIGWQLKTGDVDRWRAQLRHATYLYKSKGTRQCLEDAVALIFPNATFNPFEKFYSTYESFLPRLIYYLIATESWASNSPEYHKGKDLLNSFEENSNYSINHISGNKDVNLRFLTDYVLERLHSATDAIMIGGKPFDITTWTSDLARQGFQDIDKLEKFPEEEGFQHRGKLVKVPPWENDRFYDETYVTLEQIEVLSEILTDPSSLGGLEVPLGTIADLSSYVKSSSIDSTLLQGSNSKWKFLTSSLHQPPNLADVISRFDVDAMGLADYWSSKGSSLVTEIVVSSFVYDIDEGINIPTSGVINTVTDILREYIPFHAVLRVQAKENLEDIYSQVEDKTLEFGEGIEALLDTDASGPDFDTNIFRNIVTTTYHSSAIPNIDYPSSIMVTYPSTPRTTLRRRGFKSLIGSPPYFRDGKSMPVHRALIGVSSGPSSHPGFNTWEKIPYGLNASSGKFFSTSGTASGIWRGYLQSETGLEPAYQVALAGITGPKFEHETDNVNNRFDPTTYYNRSSRSDDSTIVHYDQPVYKTFPVRGYYEEGLIGAITRNELTPFQAVVYRRAIREAKTKGSDPLASRNALQNLEFGYEFQSLYRYYTREMSSRLRARDLFRGRFDYAADRTARFQSPTLGGFGLIDHAYGPLVYNNDFSIRGPLAAGLYDSSLYNHSGIDAVTTVGDVEEAHYILANEYCKGIKLSLINWDTKNNYIYTLSGDGTGNQNPPATGKQGRFIFGPDSRHSVKDARRKTIGSNAGGNNEYWNCPTLVSGVDIISDSTEEGNRNKFIVVYNQPGSDFMWEHGPSLPSESGNTGSISLITPNSHISNTNQPQGIRFPLTKGLKRLSNSDFKYFPKGWSEGPDNFPHLYTSSLAGWKLYDISSLPDWNAGHTTDDRGHGTVGVSALGGDKVEWADGYVPDHNQKYLIYADVSGSHGWKQSRSIYIFSQDRNSVAGYSHEAGSLNTSQLIPGQPYKLSITAKSNHEHAYGYEVWIRNNTHHKAQYTPSAGGNWMLNNGEGATVAMRNRWHGGAPQDLTADQNGWTTCSITFTPSSTFGIDDDYSIYIAPFGPYNSGAYVAEFNEVLFESIKLETELTTGEYNNLHPNHDYEITLTAYLPNGANANLGDYSLDFALYTDSIPVVPNSEFYNNETANNYFDFVNNVWEVVGDEVNEPTNPDYALVHRTVNFADSQEHSDPALAAEGWRQIKLNFNTRNEESPLAEDSRWVRHGSLLHTTSSPYWLEVLTPVGGFAPNENSNVNLKGLTVDSVSIVDLSMSSIVSSYKPEEVEAVFNTFDQVSTGIQSRSWTTASGTNWDPTLLSSTTNAIQTSGGARGTYLERFGSEDYSGVSANHILDEGSAGAASVYKGIVYEIIDE